MTFDEISAARFSWAREFQQRHVNRVRDDDELIWARGLMANAHSASILNGYVITAEGDIQGIVVIDEELRISKTQPSAALAYVRYLATAPWNRQCDEYVGRFRGIGRLLVVQAVAEGMALGSCGRIGLHSFLGARPFYDRLGFKNLGVDPAERGMLYFELLPDAAQALLSTVTR
jgi:hypothetical protein